MVYEVLIIGGGVTGLSTAWHLQQLGIKDVALASSRTGVSRLASGIISGGMVDNYTRVSHAHGSDFAQKIWQFGDQAFCHLQDFAQTHKIPFLQADRLRYITAKDELKEAQLACQEMKAAQIECTLDQSPKAASQRILAVQNDGPLGGFISPPALLAKLEEQVGATRLSRITELQSSSSPGLLAVDGKGVAHKSELVVCGCHLDIAQLIPNLKDALVAIADQWITVETDRRLKTSPHVYSAHHTYEWGARTSARQWRLGGGRYLRPMAGIEASHPSTENRISLHLIKQFKSLFGEDLGVELLAEQGFLDCRPCDELPIIGPMFGDSRLLVGTGYMGSGLTMGFYAGKCLAELIAHGKCADLPRGLWPERLRSLQQTS